MRIVSRTLPLACIAFGLSAQDYRDNRESLRGMNAVAVFVGGDIPDDVMSLTNLSKEQIQTDTELRLRREHITVGDERVDMSSKPYLNIQVVAMAERSADNRPLGTVASIRVVVQQMVVLSGNPAVTLLAPTWSYETVISASNRQFARLCRDSVLDFVDRFINAYLSVNQKTTSAN